MKHTLILISSLTLLASCDKGGTPEEFDRSAMLTNMADNVIVPELNGLGTDLEALDNSADAFVAAPNASNLNDLKADYIAAYYSFQHCKMYDFGPMMDYAVKSAMNTYPTDTIQIQSNISSGSYNLGTIENVDAIGFPAIDFLLYYQSESQVINSFDTAPDAANRRTYLTDITSKMKTEFDLVISGWSNYKADFIANDGNDAASSTSSLFNEFLKDIELAKNAKIGIPAGQQTGGQTLPSYVEGYYSGQSINLAIESIKGLKKAFSGDIGLGFDDYVVDVQGMDGTGSLAHNIQTQFNVVSDALAAIGSPLSEKVDTNPTAVNTAYLELKKLVTYCKTDMSSTLGLLVTFQDNDGD